MNSISRRSSLPPLNLHIPRSVYCNAYWCYLQNTYSGSDLSLPLSVTTTMAWVNITSHLDQCNGPCFCLFFQEQVRVSLFFRSSVCLCSEYYNGSPLHTNTPTSLHLVFCYTPHTLLSSHSGLLAILPTLLTWPWSPFQQKSLPEGLLLCQCSCLLQAFAQIFSSWWSLLWLP